MTPDQFPLLLLFLFPLAYSFATAHRINAGFAICLAGVALWLLQA